MNSVSAKTIPILKTKTTSPLSHHFPPHHNTIYPYPVYSNHLNPHHHLLLICSSSFNINITKSHQNLQEIHQKSAKSLQFQHLEPQREEEAEIFDANLLDSSTKIEIPNESPRFMRNNLET